MPQTPDDGPLRDERRAPFCYQTHDALAAIRAHFTGQRRSTAIAVYVCLTEAANRKGGAAARSSFRATRHELAELAGVSLDTIDRYAPDLAAAGVLEVRKRAEDGVNLPNQWVLVEPAPLRGVAAGLRPGGGRSDAALIDLEKDLEKKNPPPTPSTRPGKVGGHPVTDAEYEFAQAVLAAFNAAGGNRFASKDFVAKIVLRHREHPEVDLAGHDAAIRASFAERWWKGAASPLVVYGNGGVFETALARAASEARLGAGPGDAALDPAGIEAHLARRAEEARGG